MIVTSTCSGDCFELFGQRPGGGGVTLADVGGQDQDPARSRRPGAHWVCGGGVA